MRSAAEIDKLIGEWESLRADYTARGAIGIVDVINVEIRKLRRERATTPVAEAVDPKPAM